MKIIDYELNEKIHGIILNPYLSKKDFEETCSLIKKINLKNISTSLNFLRYLKDAFSTKEIKINALISYPFADLPNNFIKDLISFAKEEGANRIEYTPKFFLLSQEQEELFANDIEFLSNSDLPYTLIFNKHKLDKNTFQKSIKIALELGVTNFQFGDGFGPPMNLKDICELKNFLSDNSILKVVNGVRNIKEVIEIFNSGVDYVGTSNFKDIFQQINSN